MYVDTFFDDGMKEKINRKMDNLKNLYNQFIYKLRNRKLEQKSRKPHQIIRAQNHQIILGIFFLCVFVPISHNMFVAG